jgi:hypothetical protein
MTLLTAFGGVNTEAHISASSEPTPRALPPLYAYSPEFQARAADEMAALAPVECAKLVKDASGCSALRTIGADYGTVRKKLRALDARPE